MAIREERTITLHPDGSASYCNQRILEEPGKAPVAKPVKRKRVAAEALLPSRGALRVLPLHCALEPVEEGGVTVYVTQESPRTRRVQWETVGDTADSYDAMRRRLRTNGAHHLWGESASDFAERLRTQREFVLAFPYVVQCYVFVRGWFTGVSSFYRNHPITSETDELYHANFPNQHDGRHEWKFCEPKDARTQEYLCGSTNTIEVVRRANAVFWGSVWNGRLPELFLATAKQVPEVASPWEWELLSARDPGAMTRLPWMECAYSVGDFVRRCLATAQERQSTATFFDALVQRVDAADDLDAPPPSVAPLAKVFPSTAQHLQIGDAVWQVGDAVRVAPSCVPECPAGGEFRIVWFGRKVGKRRHVQLEGVSAPVLLMDERGQCGAGLSHIPVATAVPMGEITIAPGMVCRMTDALLWQEWKEREYLVTAARRDAAGYVRVLLRNGKHATARECMVGTQDASFSGLQWLPAEDVDASGNLRVREVTLADGTTVRVGDHLLYVRGDQVTWLTIEAVIGRGYASGLRRRVRSGGGGEYCIEGDAGGLSPEWVLLPAALPTSVRVGNRRIVALETKVVVANRMRVVTALAPVTADGRQYVQCDGGVGWVLLATQGSLAKDISFLVRCRLTKRGCIMDRMVYPRGQYFLHRATSRCVPAIAYHLVEETLEVEGRDGQRLRLVEQGRRVKDVVPLLDRIRVGAMELRQGMRLQLQSASVQYRAGKRFTVLAIAHEDTMQPPIVITTSGAGFRLTKTAAEQFRWREGAVWRSFPTEEDAYPGKLLPAPSARLDVGTRVRYLGGDPQAHFTRHDPTEERARCIPATIVRSCGTMCGTCRFDEEIPGGTDDDGRYKDGKRYQHLEYRCLEPIPTGVTWEQAFRPVGLRFRRSRMVDRGRVIGRDRTGAELRVGDRVRALSCSDSSPDAARRLIRESHVCTIVHAGANGGDVWAYLHMGRDVGQRKRTDVVGYDTIPAHLREDPSWWTSISWARIRDCTRVEHGAEKQEQTTGV
ncbi:hypothetical protein HY632_00350 [Candidatus Uhrbacteria bacterium]|nr:hypothetical protein [Candidatus Uhrbacteria bacterium]